MCETGFFNALPHPKHISHQSSKITGDPGFTEPAFQALSLKVQANKNKDEAMDTIVTLMFDEMSIKKYVDWDENKFTGYVYSGDDEVDDSAPLAENVLVFMAVAVNGSFKVTLGYFPCVSMTGKEKANLVRLCLKKLVDLFIYASQNRFE